MDWQKELEARLADDPRLERKNSRLSTGVGFFFRGKEILNFPASASASIRMSAAMVYALKSMSTEDCVKEVSKDGMLLRLESEGDLEFTQKVLEKIFREKVGERRPEGRNTRPGGWSAKRKAHKPFEDAQALKALRELKKDPEG
jgi:hypothetical protein